MSDAEQEFKFLFKSCLLYLYLNNSEFTQQDGRKKRTAKLSCATNVTGLLLLCFVVIITLHMFSGLITTIIV